MRHNGGVDTGIIIGIVVAVVVVVLALLVLGLVLARRRRISLHQTPPAGTQGPVTGEKPQVDKPGTYKANTGFSFTQGGGGAATVDRPARRPGDQEGPSAPPAGPTGPTGPGGGPGAGPTAPPVPGAPGAPAGPATPRADERTDTDGQPMVGDDASVPRDSQTRSVTEVTLPDEFEVAPETETPETTEPEPEPTTEPESTEPEPTTEPESTEPEPTTEPGQGTTETSAPTSTIEAESAGTDVAGAPAQDTAPSDEVLADAGVTEADAPVETLPAETLPVETPAVETAVEEIEPAEGRLHRLRGRLARSQSVFGKSVLGLLGGGDLDEDSWEEIEDTLLMADLGTATTTAVVDKLRSELAANPVRSADEARALFRAVLVEHLMPELDRSVKALPHSGHPAILLVVGVNGTGKTTTTGKLARVLVADGRRILLGAADTFRAAAADQLQTWGERVGAQTVRGKEAADPASVAFDAVSQGIDSGVDAVIIDTAGRLHTKTGLMDELGKVKRVVEKKASVDEVLLVLDATIGQNGLAQAKVFADVVDISGVVLTKLDGTAKGGIVFQVQNELRVPVKLVGLGEGADDLAPFDPEAFVDALLG
ncbi:signal recognition particle receptor FtsY [Gordonia jinhuaensis]|uniref:Signal recognition particle receptor FtsY n=1 Tax=Gordonia jinhuaensis TaxID=1517702 RepID=A0A916T3P6_9ACTN|nr:signal recognition particle receptor FtsY [Gordonia jinhuaensis]